QYEQGLAEAIAREALRSGGPNQESPLVLVHAVCNWLWQIVRAREDKVARADDVKNLGGVEKGLYRYTEHLVKSTAAGKDRKALAALLYQLYVRQPDGSVTRDLLHLDDLQEKWSGPTPLTRLTPVLAADTVHLLDLTWANVNGKEGDYVSLG